MSVETELKRIADALEKLVIAQGVKPAQTPAATAPAKTEKPQGKKKGKDLALL